MLSIQEVVESRLEIMLGTPVAVTASGRTDAGVHARAQVVSFHGRTRMQPVEILRGLNSLLPPDIAVIGAEEADESFHARFSAVSKTYEYLILNRPEPSALLRKYAWHIRQPLAAQPMVQCLDMILGPRDFSAFMASGSPVSSTERSIYRATLDREPSGCLRFCFEANGFLRHMVRNLVGTIVEVGRGKRGIDDFCAVLESRDRKRAGLTAPARGLYLVSVNYGVRPQPGPQEGQQ
jgi:tRNA pseudouridine38-40 synthase